MGFFFISFSILSFALSNCLWVYPLKRLSFLQLIILRSFLTTIMFATLLAINLFTGVDQTLVNGQNTKIIIQQVLQAVAICGFCYFGLYFYVLSLKEEKVGIAVPVSGTSSLFGVLFGVVVLRETISFLYAVSGISFAVGVYFIDYRPNRSFTISRGVLYNLAAAFFWGFGFAMFVYPVKSIGTTTFSFILEVTVCLFSMMLFKWQSGKWSLPLKEIDSTILFLALLGFCGVMFYNLSLLYLPVSVISLMNVLTPATSFIFSAILLKERLQKLQYIGVLIILSGILILQQIR